MENFYNKRAFKHNYHAPFIYHIILKKNKNFPNFGVVKGDAKIPYDQPGCACIEENNFGMTISKSIIGLPKKYPIIQIFQHKTMPDHVHILLQVKEWSKFPLDFYIKELTNYIAQRISKEINREIASEDIFLEGFCDKPLLLKRSLNDLFNYIKENPHRLAMRIQYPQFFHRQKKLVIGEKEYEAYGNLFLLRNPDKLAVRIRRHFTDKEIKEHHYNALEMASKGTVLVSPFISKSEKDIRYAAEEKGAKIILIKHEKFGEKYKPPKHDFDLCCAGGLLIISLCMEPKTPLTYQISTMMNELAAYIANKTS